MSTINMKSRQNIGAKLLAATAIEIDCACYDKQVNKALSVLSYGGHYSHAVNVGIMAVLRNDQRTLRRLVKTANYDTRLIEALQNATGKKLAYLAHEF